MKKQHGWMNRLLDRVELSGEPLPRQPLVELAGDRRVLVENHCGVTEYRPDQIQIQVPYGQICILGRALSMVQVTVSQLVITGCVDELRLIRR